MFLPDFASLDLRARWCIMSAYLYYRMASPVIHDAYYDRLVKEVARGWSQLDPFRQWQLGSLYEFEITGHRVKITTNAENAALAWHHHMKGVYPHGHRISEGEWKPDVRCRWAYAEPTGVTLKRPTRRKPAASPRPEQFKLF